MRIIVIGAGAFGGWTALELLRRGQQVTLVDAWGPGHSRASSGGETRVIRATYGPRGIYTRLAVRSLTLWKQAQQQWNVPLFRETGVLWMVSKPDDSCERESLLVLKREGVNFKEFKTADMAERWPHIDITGVRWALFEPESGYLFARRACQAVAEAYLREGGEYVKAEAALGDFENRRMKGLRLSNGRSLSADQYIFACGPWLPKLFPALDAVLTPTRQEVFFFGAPAGDVRFSDAQLPVWIDHGERFIYGIPGNEGRGFKVADDTRGPKFDPTSGDRQVSPEGLAVVQSHILMRFPALKGAPLVESRVCQYEQARDEDFIVDRHPAADNVWIVGGGSGHGFKHGPAMGELVADAVLRKEAAPEMFGLKRFGLAW